MEREWQDCVTTYTNITDNNTEEKTKEKEKEPKKEEKSESNTLNDKLQAKGIDPKDHKDILNSTFLSDEEKEGLISQRHSLGSK